MRWAEVMPIGDLPSRAAERMEGDAVVFPHERATFAELEERATRYARGLLALGLGRGDHVGILLAPGVDYVAAFLGVAKLGAVPVPVNARFKGLELGHVIPHADLRALLVGGGDGPADYAGLVARVLPSLAATPPGDAPVEAPLLRHAIQAGGAALPGMLSQEAVLAGGERVPEADVRAAQSRVRVRDLGMIMYTSGTTSAPKGCMLTHEALVRQARNYAERYRLGPGEAFWDALPLFHIGGIVPLLGCVDSGTRYCHVGSFDATEALAMLERERCTVAMPVFETMWLAVLGHPRFAAADLGALRMLLALGVPEQLRAMQARLPHVAQVSGSGSTECGGNLVLGDQDDPYETRMTTCGRLMPGMELRVVDPASGRDAAVGEPGELLARGAGLFEGYYKEPQLNAEVFDADGWYHSGDLATLDTDGRLAFGGRGKDGLKVGGENVSPLEVEDYLKRHPAVGIAQVVGVPDRRYTEVPAAFIELAPGASASEAEIVAFCVDAIATYKVPRYVRFVREWPMSGTKIEKRTLRERLAEELRAAGVTEAPRVRAEAP